MTPCPIICGSSLYMKDTEISTSSAAFVSSSGKETTPVSGERIDPLRPAGIFRSELGATSDSISSRSIRSAKRGTVPNGVLRVTMTSIGSPARQVRTQEPAPVPPAWRPPHRTTTSLLASGKSSSTRSTGICPASKVIRRFFAAGPFASPSLPSVEEKRPRLRLASGTWLVFFQSVALRGNHRFENSSPTANHSPSSSFRSAIVISSPSQNASADSPWGAFF